MAPSTIYTRASTTLTSSSNPSVLRSLASSNARRARAVQVRSLWWWGRRGTWPSEDDKSIIERIEKHERMMRHRHWRALRRRDMWDRDDGVHPWMLRASPGRPFPEWKVCRNPSSNDAGKGRLDTKRDEADKFWAKTQKDFEGLDKGFEAFKADLDRALLNDSYGTLFGRRLQSPPSENNSSWISWLFNKGVSMSEPAAEALGSSNKRKIHIEVLDKKPSSKTDTPQSPKSKSEVAATQEQQVPQVEYTYDPISGRKVPNAPGVVKSALETSQSFFETLFAEHGATPDKPVKHHQVHGHGHTPNPGTSRQDTKSATPKKEFESSRMSEYHRLRAATLGTNIDTTAEFGGKYVPEPANAEDEPEKPVRKMPALNDDTPLFTGTTYETKAHEIVEDTGTKRSSWLEKEGFQSQISLLQQSTQPIVSSGSRLQPALDRIVAAPAGTREQKFISKLQPAIDRVQLLKTKDDVPVPVSAKPLDHSEQPKSLHPPKTAADTDKREDLDLLRASDIRAATKTVRMTKHELTQAKIEKRNHLESEFDKVPDKVQEIYPNAKQLRADLNKLCQNTGNVWKHAEQTPTGAPVAGTMRSLSLVNEESRDHPNPNNLYRVDLTAPLPTPVDSSKIASIYRDVPKLKRVEVEVPQSVKDEEKAQQALTENLRLSNKIAAEIKKRDDAQIQQLASGIREVFEAEHGPIDLSLAQNSLSKPKEQTQIIAQAETKRYDDAGAYFAERERFIAEVGTLKKDVAVIKSEAAKMEKLMNDKSISISTYTDGVGKLLSDVKHCNKTADGLTDQWNKRTISDQAKPHPLSMATVKPGVAQYPSIERHTRVFEPRLIQLLSEIKAVRISLREVSARLHDLKRSRVAKDDEKPSKSSTPEQESRVLQTVTETAKPALKAFDGSSPHLLLVYNKTTGEVDKTGMDRLPWSPVERDEKANPMRIMGKLNYPAAFVTHFVELENAGYELSSGGGDMLIFQKKAVPQPAEFENHVSQPTPTAPKMLRNTIATEEASSQPEITETIAQPRNENGREFATVLDSIPTEIPTPGPAAPTAPPTYPTKKPPRSGPKVQRQEHVFSGTIPIRTVQVKSKQNSSRNNKGSSNDQDASFFGRTARTLKRGVLGVAAFGTAAYTIGVVAEGIGAQAQSNNDAVAGPRTKVVMPTGQRPGIYSTESSRNE